MAVNPVMNGNNNVNGTRGGTSADDLTQSFMTLLVAQMQNQDPTNPMDNNQLTLQLAQFNTAAGVGVAKLNSTLESVVHVSGQHAAVKCGGMGRTRRLYRRRHPRRIWRRRES
ncbi:hypothetical protein E05_34230 [Plautia stali symbiont]|nr:hypothetical protein E05_34230 [Plautia stali symbiont]